MPIFDFNDWYTGYFILSSCPLFPHLNESHHNFFYYYNPCVFKWTVANSFICHCNMTKLRKNNKVWLEINVYFCYMTHYSKNIQLFLVTHIWIAQCIDAIWNPWSHCRLSLIVWKERNYLDKVRSYLMAEFLL